MKYSINIFRDIFLVLFILILPFSVAISNIFFGIYSAIILIDYFYYKEKIDVNRLTIYFIIILCYLSINGLFQGSYNANKTLWKFIPILLFGSLLMYSTKKLPLAIIKKASVFTCLILVISCLIRTVIFYSENHFIPFANDAEMVNILKIHRPYLGFYILINSIFSFDLFIKSSQKIYKYLYSFIFIIFFAFIVLIAARLSIISFIVIALIYILFYLDYSLIKKIILGVSLLVLSGFIYSNPKIQERVNHNNIDMMIDHEPRFVIWESVNNIKNNDDFNSLIGYGNYQLIEDYLIINYEKIINKKEKRDYFVKEQFNTHSQFFDYLLFGGYIAFTLFISFCLFSLWYTKQNFTSFAIISAFILFFLVENVFHRQLGCYLFILYYMLALRNTKLPED